MDIQTLSFQNKCNNSNIKMSVYPLSYYAVKCKTISNNPRQLQGGKVFNVQLKTNR